MNATLDLQEKRQHGGELFPFALYLAPLNNEFPIMYVHWHREIEIVLFRHGSATYCIDSDQYELRDGDIFIVQPRRIHSATTHDCAGSEIYAMVFDIETLLGSTADVCTLNYIAPLVNGRYQIPALIKRGSVLCEQLNACGDKLVTAYYAKAPFYELQIKSLLLEFLNLLFSGGGVVFHRPVTAQSMACSARVKKTIQYINENYNKEVYLDGLADEVGYSVNHLIRLFRATTGMTPFAYLNRIRLLRAAELLMQSEKSVTEISLDIGYTNISYFQKKFKSFFKTSPARYRKAYYAYRMEIGRTQRDSFVEGKEGCSVFGENGGEAHTPEHENNADAFIQMWVPPWEE